MKAYTGNVPEEQRHAASQVQVVPSDPRIGTA